MSGAMPALVREMPMCPGQRPLLSATTCHKEVSSPVLPLTHGSGNCMLPIAAATLEALKQADLLQRTGLYAVLCFDPLGPV